MTRADRKRQAIATWEASRWDDVARFLGPNAERFRAAWEKTRAKALDKGAGIAFGWSWPALVFGFAWFFYRKQWWVGAALLLTPIVLGYFLETRGSFAGVAIVMAMYAKSFVVSDAVAKIARIRARGGGDDAIAAAGGVSVIAGVIAGAILLVTVAAAAVALLAPDPVG